MGLVELIRGLAISDATVKIVENLRDQPVPTR